VERRHHFVHRQAPEDPRHDITYARRATVRLLRDWIGEQSKRLEALEDVEVDGVAITLLVRSPTGRRVAIVYTDRRLGADAWWETDDRLKAAQLPAAWIFALRRSFFALPAPDASAPPDDPVRQDLERGDLVLDRALFRSMRRAGSWPLLVSLERQELANLVRPGGRVAERLGLRAPASAERLLHLVPSPLASCRLTRYGIATLAVGENVLAVPWRPARSSRR
jgi:hypothetical protein